jgi:hypothetical protein
LQPLMNVGDRRNPFASEQIEVHRPVALGDGFVHVVVQCRVRHPGAGLEAVDDQVDRLDDADHQPHVAAQVIEAFRVNQHFSVSRRQREPWGLTCIDLEHA